MSKQGLLIKDHRLTITNTTGERITASALDAGELSLAQADTGVLAWNPDPIKPVDDTLSAVHFVLPQFSSKPDFVLVLDNEPLMRPTAQMSGPGGCSPGDEVAFSSGDQVTFVFHRQRPDLDAVPVFHLSRLPDSWLCIEWQLTVTAWRLNEAAEPGPQDLDKHNPTSEQQP